MLPSLFTALFDLDAATADLLWTATMCTLLLAAGGVTLAMLPWSDREISDVDDTFRGLLTFTPSRGATVAPSRPVTFAPARRAARGAMAHRS
jgi:hypothetical protein